MGRSEEKFLRSLRRWVAASAILEFIGLCIQLVAVFGPAWFYTTDGHSRSRWRLQEGIWLARFCRADDTCITGRRENVFEKIGVDESLSPLDEKHWLVFRILTTMSILTGVVSVICSVVSLVKSVVKCNTCHLAALLITAELTCVFAFTSMGVPVLQTIALASQQTTLSSTWSMLLGIHVIVLYFLTSVILTGAVCQCIQRIYRLKMRRVRREERRMRNETLSSFLFDRRTRQNIPPAEDNLKPSLETRNRMKVSTVNRSGSNERGDGGTGIGNGISALDAAHCALPSYDEISGV